jgi:hypothetical protein
MIWPETCTFAAFNASPEKDLELCIRHDDQVLLQHLRLNCHLHMCVRDLLRWGCFVVQISAAISCSNRVRLQASWAGGDEPGRGAAPPLLVKRSLSCSCSMGAPLKLVMEPVLDLALATSGSAPLLLPLLGHGGKSPEF